MSVPKATGPIVVSPHRFVDLDREQALADELGIDLIDSGDVDSFRGAVADAEIVMITPYARLTEQDFANMSKCRAVVRYGMGYDNIDVAAAAEAGIPVAIVPGIANEEVASHALALGLALIRRLPEGHAAIQAGGWNGDIAYDTPRVSQLEVGVVGMGRIGQIVARFYAALGAKVRAYDPFADFADVPSVPLPELLENSDVVSLHVPLNEQTRNLISADVLKRMRKGSVIVNVSRGGLIDEDALAAVLQSGHLAGAALDVFTEEPLSSEHVLRGVPRVILTPHIAWRSNRSSGAVQEGAVSRARLALCGQPIPDLVN